MLNSLTFIKYWNKVRVIDVLRIAQTNPSRRVSTRKYNHPYRVHLLPTRIPNPADINTVGKRIRVGCQK
jgi:hypothetical protein